jgi:hypothetical protein
MRANRFDSTPEGQVARGLADMLALELRDARAAGLDVGKSDGYLPRVPDRELAINDPQRFVKLATQAFMHDGASLADATAKAERWVRNAHLDEWGIGPHDFVETTRVGGPTSKPSFMEGRTLSKGAELILERGGFYNPDPVALTMNYVRNMARRIEAANRFGADGAKWEAMKERMHKAGVGYMIPTVIGNVRSMMGTSGQLTGMRAKGMNFLRVMGTVSALTRSFMPSLPEALTIATRTGRWRDLAIAVGKNIDNVSLSTPLKNLRSAASRDLYARRVALGEAFGLITKAVDTAASAMRFEGLEHGGTWSRYILSRFFKANMLAGLTRQQHLTSMEMGMSAIERWAGEATRGSRLAAMRLRELGFADADHAELNQWIKRRNSDIYAIPPEGNRIGDMYRGGLYRFATQTVQEASRAVRPRLAADAYGSMLYSFQNFNYATAQNVRRMVLLRAKQGILNPDGDLTPRERVALFAPLGIALAAISPVAAGMAALSKSMFGAPPDPRRPTPWWHGMVDAIAATPFAGSMLPRFWNLYSHYQGARSVIGQAVPYARNIVDALESERGLLQSTYNFFAAGASAAMIAVPAGPIGTAVQGAAMIGAALPQVRRAVVDTVMGPPRNRPRQPGAPPPPPRSATGVAPRERIAK